MKVWISKYALTQGLYQIEAKRWESNPNNIEQNQQGRLIFYHGEGKEWHLTKEGAIEQGEFMRQNKIKSLKKQIEKLNKLTFS